MKRQRRLAFALACIPVATPVIAEAPPPVFFKGQYHMIGIDSAGPVDQRLRIDPSGDSLVVTTCSGNSGRLAYKMAFEVGILVGDIDGKALNCQYFIDHGNYPLLACYGDNGTRLTLWPDTNGFATAPLICH